MRHVGTTAAAFAAQDFRADAHQVDGVEALGEIGRHADDEAGTALLIEPDQRHDAGAELRLAVIDQALEVLRVHAFDDTGHQLDAARIRNAVIALGRTAAQRQLLARLGELALELLALIEQGFDTLDDVGRRHAQHRGRGMDTLVLGIEIAPRRFAGERLETAHARGGSAFRDDLDEADIAGAPRMRAAA